MLGKLMKYDLKSMFKSFVPLWLALIAVSFLNRFLFFRNAENQGFLSNSPAVVSMILYVCLIVAVVVVTIALIIMRFYNGLLKDEGYLMFTLPVRTWQLIGSKCLTATIITLLSMIAGVISVVCLIPTIAWHEVIRQFVQYAHLITGEMVLSCVLLAVLILVSILKSVTYIYTALALGHLANRHRVGWSVAAFIGMNVVLSLLGTILINILGDIFPDWNLNGFWNQISSTAMFNWTMLVMIGITLIQVIVFFIVTERILSKRLNLE